MRWRVFGMVAALSAVAACSSGNGTPGAGGGESSSRSAGTGGGGGGAAPVVLGACETGYADECALLDVPLDHANPSGETISFHIARHRAKGTATRQLWMLAGGPGQAGSVFTPVLDDLAERMPDT